MQQDHVAGLHRIALLDHALDGDRPVEQGGCIHVADVLRQFERPVGGKQPRLSIGPDGQGRRSVGHAVADLELVHAFAQRLDEAHPLQSGREGDRQLGHGVGRRRAATIVDVGEIDPDRRLADADLARGRCARIELDQFHHLGRPERFDDDCFGHGLW